MRILFLTEGKTVPASRFRVCQYVNYLRKAGMKCSVLPCWPQKYYLPRWHKKKFIGQIIIYFYFGLKIINRLWGAVKSPFYDVIFLQRDLLSWNGPPILEILLRKFSKKIIFDFDDAIYINSPKKIPTIIKLSDFIVVGNRYLKNYTQKCNPNARIIPTCVDTNVYRPGDRCKESKITIGWMGTSSGIENLKIVSEALKKLTQRYDFTFKIVSDLFPQFDFFKDLKSTCRKWGKKEELEELQSFDIGIMPLKDNEINKGKCGFKALLYMSCGIPVVVSPVGVNKEIVQDGRNGFLADTEEEWIKRLSRLIEDRELRKKIGMAGRKTVEEKYSIKANLPKLMDVFQKIHGKS